MMAVPPEGHQYIWIRASCHPQWKELSWWLVSDDMAAMLESEYAVVAPRETVEPGQGLRDFIARIHALKQESTDGLDGFDREFNVGVSNRARAGDWCRSKKK